MKSFIIIFLFSVIIIFLQSCFRFDSYPPEPEVKFIEFSYKDSVDILGNKILSGKLQFSFVDGDGNIGFGIDSSSSKTVFIDKYKIENEIAVHIDLDEDIINFKVPYFSTSGNRKPLKGEIEIESLDEIPPVNPKDTIMYKFYIIDRDWNKSNVDSTGYLILGNYL